MSSFWYFQLKWELIRSYLGLYLCLLSMPKILVCSDIHKSTYLLILQYECGSFKTKILIMTLSVSDRINLHSRLVPISAVLLAERNIHPRGSELRLCDFLWPIKDRIGVKVTSRKSFHKPEHIFLLPQWLANIPDRSIPPAWVTEGRGHTSEL